MISLASIAVSKFSRGIARSASTVRPAGLTSAKPPITTIGSRVLPLIDRHDAGPQSGHQWRVSGQNAHVAFGAGQIDLIHVAGEQNALGRNEFEVKLQPCVI